MAKPVTLVLGLGRDVGPACARRMKEAGHSIVVADPDAERLEKASEALLGEGVFHHGRLDSRLGVRNCFAAATEAYGRLDNLIIIPPISGPMSLSDLSMDAFDKALAGTLRAGALTLHLFQAALAEQTEEVGIERKRQRGAATFVLSMSARLAQRNRFVEATSQAAVSGLVRAAAVDLSEIGIRCNAITAVRPRAEDGEPWLKQRTPLKRAALADEIAQAAYYLTDPGSAIITGETLVLDGGRSVFGGIIEPGNGGS